MACAAGTIYRNYFAQVPSRPAGDLGQTQHHQINNLDELEKALNNEENKYWNILNGYAFCRDASDLARLNEVLLHQAHQPPSPLDQLTSKPTLSSVFSLSGEGSSDPTGTKSSPLNTEDASYVPPYDELLERVKIGLHADVGVDFRNRYSDIVSHREGLYVTQTYCSALSCAYSGVHNHHWAPLARLVLQANYEATLWAAVLNLASHHPGSVDTETSPAAVADVSCGSGADDTFGSVDASADAAAEVKVTYHHDEVFLTLLGGGVFGNDIEWIAEAIGRAIAVMHRNHAPIRVHISHYRSINQPLEQMVEQAYQHYMQHGMD